MIFILLLICILRSLQFVYGNSCHFDRQKQNRTHSSCRYNDKWQLNSIGPISSPFCFISRYRNLVLKERVGVKVFFTCESSEVYRRNVIRIRTVSCLATNAAVYVFFHNETTRRLYIVAQACNLLLLLGMYPKYNPTVNKK